MQFVQREVYLHNVHNVRTMCIMYMINWKERDRHRRSSDPRVPSSAGTGNKYRDSSGLTVVTFNMRVCLCLSLSFFLLLLFSPRFLRDIVPTPWSCCCVSHPRHSPAYLVYSFNTSLSNRLLPLLQLQYRGQASLTLPLSLSSARSHWEVARRSGNRSPPARYSKRFTGDCVSTFEKSFHVLSRWYISNDRQ